MFDFRSLKLFITYTIIATMAFPVPLVKEFCCGCDLQTGTVIIGCINLAGVLLLIGLGLLGLCSWANNAMDEEIDQKMFVPIVVVNSALIHGARKGIPYLLTPFILLGVFNVVRGFVMIFYWIFNGKIIMAFVEVISFAFKVYSMIIVLSFKNELNVNS